MPYINFKEEIAKAKEQLKNRKENNKKLCKTIHNDKDMIAVVSDQKYSFNTFKDRTLNNSKTQNESEFIVVSSKNIICAEFRNCKLYNIKFKDCNFIGCNFINCDFGGGGVIFDNCNFYQKEIEVVPNLNKKDNLSCSFNNCTMYCKFSCCNISYLIFQETILKDTSFEQTDMTSVIIIDSTLKCINIIDSDLSGIKIVNTYIEGFEFNDKVKSKLDEKSFVDKIKIKKKTKDEYEGIYMVYETIADKFKQNTLNNNFGEYYYLCKVMQRKTLKILPRIGSYIYWATCGYGERILFPLVTSLLIIILFALIYMFIGIEVDMQPIKYELNLGIIFSKIIEFIKHFNEALNLSVGTFAGMGITETTPVSGALIISDIEMIIGVTMVGVGIGTLTRKLVR